MTPIGPVSTQLKQLQWARAGQDFQPYGIKLLSLPGVAMRMSAASSLSCFITLSPPTSVEERNCKRSFHIQPALARST
jgi:hypothetical protein